MTSKNSANNSARRGVVGLVADVVFYGGSAGGALWLALTHLIPGVQPDAAVMLAVLATAAAAWHVARHGAPVIPIGTRPVARSTARDHATNPSDGEGRGAQR